MRLDQLLVRLRFAKSRALARRWIEAGHLRCNGVRVEAASHPARPGDVLTLPLGHQVRVIALDTLPLRRGPAAEARAHYRELDARPSLAIAGEASAPSRGKPEGPMLP